MMSPTYTLDANWIGWLGLAVMIAAVVVTWIWFRRKKASGGWDNGLDGPVPIEGFADCHYPEDLEEWESVLLILVDIRNDVMAKCADVYGCEQGWIVGKIAVVKDTDDTKHPNVKWSRAGDRITLKLQSGMFRHFAGEVHNVHRFGMYGPGSDRMTFGVIDCQQAIRVQDWIAAQYQLEA